MAYTIENNYTGNGSTRLYSFTFPYLEDTDIKVSLNQVDTTNFTLANATQIQFSADASGETSTQAADGSPKAAVAVRVYRDTDISSLQSEFFSGSAIRAQDLNNDFNQTLYVSQETEKSVEGKWNDTTQTIDSTEAFIDSNDYIMTAAAIDDRINTNIASHSLTDGKIWAGNGSNVSAQVTPSGDVTMANTGAFTIANLAVETGMLANDAVTGAKIGDDQIDSEHYAADSIDTEHYAPGSVDSTAIADGTIVNTDVSGSAAIAHSKLASLTDGRILVGNGSNVPVGVAVSGDVTLSNTGAVTIANDAVEQAMIADDAVGADQLASNSVVSDSIVDGTIVNADINASAAVAHSKLASVTDGQILVGNGSNVPTAVAVSGDVTIANTGAVTIANDAVEIGMIGCEQTTISDSDSHIPTSGAVVDYVASVINPIGGLEVIADDESFPNTIPAAGVVISITDAAGLQVNSSGVSTNGDALDNSTITINGFPSELRGGVGSNADPYVFGSGAGLMVVSTGSSHTYNYHQAMIREADFVQLSDDINDFNSRYRIHNGEPGSDNDDGDLVWDTNANKMKVYDGTASAWSEVTSTGDFKFLVPVDAGTTTAATFDGSDTSFDLKEATNSGSAASVTNINQLMIVLNGVVQKPNAGSWSGSGEGFYLTDSDTIRFATAPPTGSTCFIIQSGSAVSIPTPGDGTVTAAKIANGAVVAAGIGADAIDGTKIADDSIDSEHYVDGSIDNAHLADNAVDLAEMAHGTQGDVLYYGSSGAPTRLGAGTNGYFLKTQGSGANPVWAEVSIPKLATPIITGDLVVADGGTVTHTITNYDHDLTYAFTATNCSVGSINSSGQFVMTESGDHPSYTIKATTTSLGLAESAVATVTLKTRLSAPTLSSPADTQTATNVVYTITSTNANDNKLILDVGSSNFTYQSVSHGSGSKVGNTVEVTGFTTNNPAVTIQFTATATYSVTAKAVDTGGTWGDSVSSSADSIVIANTTGPFNYLVIAGGASGGTRGGGGGAGGMRSSWNSETSGGGGSSESEIAALTIGTVYTIDIGTGGASRAAPSWGQGYDGADSSISGTGLTTITCEGGGGGGDSSPATGRDGGCGGGGGHAGISGPGGSGTANQGYNGGNNNPGGNSPSGGGGGAGAVGVAGGSNKSGNGGAGLASTISGSSVTYAGGGGGSAHTGHPTPGAIGTGGSGGGGNGSGELNNGVAGTDGLGAGGGGAYGGHGPTWYASGKGGDGTVYLRMATSVYSGTQTNGTVTTSGSDTIVRWTQDGTYTA